MPSRGPTMTGVADTVTHRLVSVPGGRIHLAEQGRGPLVLLVHGFPESWYSWRHQLPALAAAGYRAVAIDVRGYGRSSKPADVAAYRMLDSWPTTSAWSRPSARSRPSSSGTTGAPRSRPTRPCCARTCSRPWPAQRPVHPAWRPAPDRRLAALDDGHGGEFYISYFQAPGRAEAEIEPDVRAG